jgi:hypothetical protein
MNAGLELISVHVPKTAGTAFRRVLEQHYSAGTLHLDYSEFVLDPLSDFQAQFPAWEAENARRLRELPATVRCVHGHFWLGKYATLFPAARKVVWLRDPVARLVSHYFFWKTLPPTDHSLHRQMREQDLSLLAFAELPGMRDVVTRVFLSGWSLADCFFVGIQEHFDADLERLGALMGWLSVTAARANRTATEGYEGFSLDTATARQIRRLNEADVALYEEALARRSNRATGLL